MKKIILSISALEEKGFGVDFVDGQVLMCPRWNTIVDAILIGVEEEGVYKLKGH